MTARFALRHSGPVGDLADPVMRRTEANRLTTRNPLPIARDCVELSVPALGDADTRPLAASRDPCLNCGTRGDLGCAHFAPCEQPRAPALVANPPRQYNTRLDPAVQARIGEARRQGQSNRQIAATFGISRGRVDHVIETLGLRVRRTRRL